ncbi:MAG TPA: ABC transporter permease [Chloroflexota bacterium]|jgi:peptide/nickel transport system permease protein
MSVILPQQRANLSLEVVSPARAQLSRLSRLLPSGRFGVSVVMLIAIFGFAIFGPFVSGSHDPLAIIGGLYDEPSATNWLGTDNFGHDVYTQLMYGTRSSLIVGLIAGVVAVGIGVVIGTVAGFRGGLLEELLMGITNVVITIPSIVVLILLSVAIATRSFVTMGLIIGVTSWPWTARAVRAQTSSLRTRPHVDVARISGANTAVLILREVIPYMLSYLCLAFVLQLASGILQEAALSLLGLGANQGVSLGIMLHWALLWESVRTGAWWAFVPPTLLLSAIAFSLLLLQTSLDEVFNPRLKRGG